MRRPYWHRPNLTGSATNDAPFLTQPEHMAVLPTAPRPALQLLVFVLASLPPMCTSHQSRRCPLSFFRLVAASLAKAPEHEPSRLLGNADLGRELHRRNALARGDEQVHRVDPLMQRDMRAFHDGAGADGEVFLALVAAVVAALARRDAITGAANRAARAVRPQAALKPDARRFCIWDHLEKLEDSKSCSYSSGQRLCLGRGLSPIFTRE